MSSPPKRGDLIEIVCMISSSVGSEHGLSTKTRRSYWKSSVWSVSSVGSEHKSVRKSISLLYSISLDVCTFLTIPITDKPTLCCAGTDDRLSESTLNHQPARYPQPSNWNWEFENDEMTEMMNRQRPALYRRWNSQCTGSGNTTDNDRLIITASVGF